MTKSRPIIFISYSHDSSEHKQWVAKLATTLTEKGIEVRLDQWDLKLGKLLQHYMEESISEACRVICICTDNYATKSNDRKGGVGYEGTIITTELMKNLGTTKFIPLVRSDNAEIPRFLKGRVYFDFSNEEKFHVKVDELCSDLKNESKRPEQKDSEHILTDEEIDIRNAPNSPVFFDTRFCSAFPGVRGIEWFEAEEGIERLKILLRPPLKMENYEPIWWWRLGNLQISKFESIGDNVVLIGPCEYKIRRIAACNPATYFQSFVYIECDPMPPSRVYKQNSLDEQLNFRSYIEEEFGTYQGNYITRAEYDDGAAVINGDVVQLDGTQQLKVRHLTPYNFLIAAHMSPINNNKFDQRLNELLDGLLSKNTTLEKLVDEIILLPRRH